MLKTPQRTEPSMDEARLALKGGTDNLIGTGTYRRTYSIDGSYWVYKYGNCQANKAEAENIQRINLEVEGMFGLDWLAVPEAVLMEDPHYLAMQFIPDTEGYTPGWCDEYYPEYCSEYCKRHLAESALGLEDMHSENVIHNNGKYYLIDLGGSWHADECCDPLELIEEEIVCYVDGDVW